MPDQERTSSVVKMVRPGGSLERARLLVENLLRSHGLEPTRHLLSESENSCSWIFWSSAPTSGSTAERTLLVLSVFLVRGAGYFRVSSPIVFLPDEETQPRFFRRLLDLNSEMVSAALATVGSEVHVVCVRPVQDLGGTEVEDIIRCVTGYGSMLREPLVRDFGAEPWDLASGPERNEEDPDDDLLDDP